MWSLIRALPARMSPSMTTVSQKLSALLSNHYGYAAFTCHKPEALTVKSAWYPYLLEESSATYMQMRTAVHRHSAP